MRYKDWSVSECRNEAAQHHNFSDILRSRSRQHQKSHQIPKWHRHLQNSSSGTSVSSPIHPTSSQREEYTDDAHRAYVSTYNPAPYISEIQATGAEPPKTCIVTCVDPRVFPERLLGLNLGEAFIFRTISGHPHLVLRDIVTLDAQSHQFEDLILIHHTGGFA